MTQKTVNVECNSINKQVNRTQLRFNIPGSDGGNNGNVNFNIQDTDLKIADDLEPGKDYKITIKEA